MVAEAEDAPRSRFAWARREVRLLPVDPVGLAVPGSCACCGAPASSSRVEVRPSDGKTLIVPYCDACQRHASAATTRAIAGALASLIAGVTLALALPLAWETAPLVVFVLIAVAVSALPIGVVWMRQGRPSPGHSAAGRAIWWTSAGELACTNPRWAAELGSATGISARLEHARERLLSPWVLAGPVLVLVGAPLVHRFHHPPLRVLNLTENRITVLLDGRSIASVEPTSAESPAAGIEIRIPSGTRVIRTLGADGALIDEARIAVRSGSEHLYAPGSLGYCFWLERTFYGRTDADSAERRPLGGSVRFWSLPSDLDTWFAPNPEPAVRDRRSSGGELLALRQARCNEAPPDAREPGG